LGQSNVPEIEPVRIVTYPGSKKSNQNVYVDLGPKVAYEYGGLELSLIPKNQSVSRSKLHQVRGTCLLVSSLLGFHRRCSASTNALYWSPKLLGDIYAGGGAGVAEWQLRI